MKPRANSQSRHAFGPERGFSLIICLIIIALASVVVVAFLTTSATERTTANAYARAEKARQFAEAGVDAGLARLTTEMRYRPYHAIGYRVVGNVGASAGAGGVTEVVPIITGARTTTSAPTFSMPPNPAEDVFLVSTIDTAATLPGTTSLSGLTSTDVVDLNANHLASEPQGWIGSPIGTATPIPLRAAWIKILKDPSQPEQHTDPTATSYNPVVGRYAYWMEDETSKLDTTVIGNKDNSGAFQRGEGVALPNRTPTPKYATNDLDIGALPLVKGSPLSAGDTTTNQAIVNFRDNLPVPDARFLNNVGGQVNSDVYETVKYYSTAFSLSDDLAGNGRRRANLNAIVLHTPAPSPAPAATPTPEPAVQIAGSIDDIAYVISGKHLSKITLQPAPAASPSTVYSGAPDNFKNTLVNFGQRFWTTPATTADQQNMYLERIAANIRDYIDPDISPTYIDTSDKVISGSKPTVAWKSGTEPRAIGKEAIPYLQEVAWAGFERKMQQDPPTTPPGAVTMSYDVDIDLYLEFMNPTTKDFTAPPGSFLKLYNRVTWDAGSYGQLAPPDEEIPIAGKTFPAGVATVVTTAPSSNDPPGLLQGSNVIRLTGVTRNFVGKTDHRVVGVAGNPVGLQLQGRAGSSATTDYSTEAVWGDSTGVYEAHAYIGVGGSTGRFFHFTQPDVGSKTRFVYSSSLRGNLTTAGSLDQPSRTGDPRSLSEQLSMSGGLSSLGTDQTRFFGSTIDSSGTIPGDTTIGLAKISYVDPTKWPDYNTSFADNAQTASGIVRDAAMQSIGELGYIYDPVRTVATNAGGPAPSILQARGGGRTLKIGQVDDLITGGRFSATWFNAAWRLTDLFSADQNIDSNGRYVGVSSPTSRGKLNINGVLRDSIDLTKGTLVPKGSGGLPFRAALRSYNFLAPPAGDSSLNGRSLTSTEIDSLVQSIQTYLFNTGPMLERGELSQLTFFNTGSFANIQDRGREEIFRRCVELITTRSAAFTVYSLGESVRQDTSGKIVTTGQKRLATTFYVDPQGASGSLQDSTTPDEAATSYKIKKVYAPN